ncbi:lipase family protein [Nocardioides sp.]|uniref:lipase family protein n=1 Tax=Nocardioides sp. TaxID=35761 RepID=UPI003219BBE4
MIRAQVRPQVGARATACLVALVLAGLTGAPSPATATAAPVVAPVIGPVLAPVATAAPVVAATDGGAAPSASARAEAFRRYDGRKPLRTIEPGTVLKTREITYSLQGLPLPIDVVQILYRTEDTLERPTVNVTSVLQPPLLAKPRRLIAYGSFYDSLNPQDGPSFAIDGGRSFGGAAVHAETALVATFLLDGMSVVMADTQGRTANFAAGPEYGRTTLDSIRAVLSSRRTGVAPRAKVGLLGYSGGAIATNWAAALAPSYAPDVNRRLVGAAEGGVLVAPARNLRYIQGSQVWAGVLAMALVGASRGFEINLERYLNRYGKQVFEEMEKASIVEVLGSYPGLTWRKIARKRFPDPEQIPAFVRAVNQLNLGRAPAPTIPMFIGQGARGEVEGTSGTTRGIGPGDGVMIAGDVRSLARRYCRQGTRVRYQQYDATSHFTTVPLWIGDAYAWLGRRLAGRKPAANCRSIAPGTSLAPVPMP